MKAITLRNLRPELARRVEEQARQRGLSLNKTVLRLLEERLLLRSKGSSGRHHDLDELAGALTADQADELEQALAEQREVDPEAWR